MSEWWVAGDVAFSPFHGRVFRSARGQWVFEDGYAVTAPLGVEPRRLVVIDPEDIEQVERLRGVVGGRRGCLAINRTKDMQSALREFANPTPPKPPEPRGLGAVVEDVEGCRWVRVWSQHGRVWTQDLEIDGQGTARHYADINAVRVLSEGATP